MGTDKSSRISLAIEFMKSKARRLDQLLYSIEFEDGDNRLFLEELITYQNSDGGFGKGIVPGLSSQHSSIIATLSAIHYAESAYIEEDHPLIEQIMGYFNSTLNETLFWYPIHHDDLSSPYFRWLQIAQHNPNPSSWPNPNAGVIGYLNKYSHYVDSYLLDQCNSSLEDYLNQHDKITGNIFCNFMAWKAALTRIPEFLNPKIFKHLDQTFPTASTLKYLDDIRIEMMVTEPSSYLNLKYPEIVKYLFLEEFKSQNKDGGWYPHWSWLQSLEENSSVELAWASKSTLSMLCYLKYFSLLDV